MRARRPSLGIATSHIADTWQFPAITSGFGDRLCGPRPVTESTQPLIPHAVVAGRSSRCRFRPMISVGDLVSPYRSRPGQDTPMTSSHVALVIAHPGHELRVHGWLEQVRPRVFI